MEDESGKEEGACNMNTLRDTRVDELPFRSLPKESPRLVPKGKLLHFLLTGRDNYPQVPDLLPFPDDRDIERAEREGRGGRLRKVRRGNRTAFRNTKSHPCPILQILVPLSDDAAVDGEVLC